MARMRRVRLIEERAEACLMGLLVVDELEEAQVSVLNWNRRQHQLMGCAFLQIDKLDAAAVTHQNEAC